MVRELDEWIRHRLKQIHLKQGKTAAEAYRELRKRGAPEALARRVEVRWQRWRYHSTHTVHVVLRNRHFEGPGVPRLAT